MTLLSKAITAFRTPPAAPSNKRSIWQNEDGNYERPWSEEMRTSEARRQARSSADISLTYASVFAAIKTRSQKISKGQLHLFRKRGTGNPIEIEQHPALDALHAINSSLTSKQGLAYAAQQKLTFGKAFWVKLRNRIGVPVEFEIWNPETVSIIAEEKRPWVPKAYRRMNRDGTSTVVDAVDVIYFRHFLDPRNSLQALSPIGAVRVQVDTGTEALRYNQRFFDNNALPAAIISAKDSGPGEVERITDDLRKNFKGTDNAFGAMVTEGDLSVIAMPMAHKDMQFLEQMKWNREEVAAVFEMSPVMIGDTTQATKENLEGYTRELWEVVVNDGENMAAELNEFYIWPDFGPEFYLTMTFDDVEALQADRKRQAEIDAIELGTAKVTINELRERDGEEAVEWGDVPIVSNTLEPLDTRSPDERAAAAPSFAPAATVDEPDDEDDEPRAVRKVLIVSPTKRTLQQAEDDMDAGWETRLNRELRALLKHLDAKNNEDGRSQRALEVGDLDDFDWDWWHKYGSQVTDEITVAMEAGLNAADYAATALDPTHDLSVRYAEGRAGELLRLEGPANVVAFTRSRVATLVAKALEDGESLRTLKNWLRQDFAFSASRAETIARTETATAQGRASLTAYGSNGFEGKEWLTAGDDRVDAGGGPTPCLDNENQGAIRLGQPFVSGHATVPAHPRCRCTIIPVLSLEVPQ